MTPKSTQSKTMEFKIILTYSVSDPEDNPQDWEYSDQETPEETVNFLIRELAYRIGHFPGGRILELETK